MNLGTKATEFDKQLGLREGTSEKILSDNNMNADLDNLDPNHCLFIISRIAHLIDEKVLYATLISIFIRARDMNYEELVRNYRNLYTLFNTALINFYKDSSSHTSMDNTNMIKTICTHTFIDGASAIKMFNGKPTCMICGKHFEEPEAVPKAEQKNDSKTTTVNESHKPEPVKEKSKTVKSVKTKKSPYGSYTADSPRIKEIIESDSWEKDYRRYTMEYNFTAKKLAEKYSVSTYVISAAVYFYKQKIGKSIPNSKIKRGASGLPSLTSDEHKLLNSIDSAITSASTLEKVSTSQIINTITINMLNKYGIVVDQLKKEYRYAFKLDDGIDVPALRAIMFNETAINIFISLIPDLTNKEIENMKQLIKSIIRSEIKEQKDGTMKREKGKTIVGTKDRKKSKRFDPDFYEVKK